MFFDIRVNRQDSHADEIRLLRSTDFYQLREYDDSLVVDSVHYPGREADFENQALVEGKVNYFVASSHAGEKVSLGTPWSIWNIPNRPILGEVVKHEDFADQPDGMEEWEWITVDEKKCIATPVPPADSSSRISASHVFHLHIDAPSVVSFNWQITGASELRWSVRENETPNSHNLGVGQQYSSGVTETRLPRGNFTISVVFTGSYPLDEQGRAYIFDYRIQHLDPA